MMDKTRERERCCEGTILPTVVGQAAQLDLVGSRTRSDEEETTFSTFARLYWG